MTTPVSERWFVDAHPRTRIAWWSLAVAWRVLGAFLLIGETYALACVEPFTRTPDDTAAVTALFTVVFVLLAGNAVLNRAYDAVNARVSPSTLGDVTPAGRVLGVALYQVSFLAALGYVGHSSTFNAAPIGGWPTAARALLFTFILCQMFLVLVEVFTTFASWGHRLVIVALRAATIGLAAPVSGLAWPSVRAFAIMGAIALALHVMRQVYRRVFTPPVPVAAALVAARDDA